MPRMSGSGAATRRRRCRPQQNRRQTLQIDPVAQAFGAGSPARRLPFGEKASACALVGLAEINRIRKLIFRGGFLKSSIIDYHLE
ncbi:hypothetical protein BQ8482_180275 [Mesorhizobium delmotii]|uniref:Uncharacterized protein n=1 Tax=Mesorhizobium delmotii TaxID=1631247 RepID=A0A2P9AIS7_9HYPH|nr:hypothetical protein BQ8482_180275 [Mesorhizobium delmotii]